MVAADDNVKFTYEKQKKATSKRVKQFAEETEISSNDTQTNEFLQVVEKSPWMNLTLRYVGAILVVILAFWLYLAITTLFGPGLPTYILFYPAIIIVALLAGLGPGLLATIISVMLAVIWILPPVGQISIKSPIDEFGVVLFTSFGILISAVSELYRRNRIKAAAYDKEKALRETQREKQFLAKILENASQPFAIGYPDGRLGLLNHSFEQLTGYTPEELHTIDWSTTLTPIEWREMEKQKLEELNRTGQPIRYEKEYIRKDGSRVPIELLVSITLDMEGNPEYYYSFITDITERKKTESIIETAMSELRRSNQELERFAYVSSHDLQEPLRMVTLYSQLLERRYKDRLDDDADDFIEYIVENAKRMKYLIDDLLEYSRVTSQAKEFENIELEKVLEYVLSNLSIPIVENNINITYNSLPTVFADKNQMLQVFQNLITNAIKFRGKESPKIDITAQKGEKEWIFAVKDNGIGINPNHQKQIFEVFKRLHTREEYPGTGIGLSIVQKIIERHGGRIWVESEPGKGSKFYFTIPIKN